MIKAKIICDSIFNGIRITTFELEYQRFILAEFNTHRVFSRNSMSSRAVPIKKMREQVWNNPATPVSWGANQSGMQAGRDFGVIKAKLCNSMWRFAAKTACVMSWGLEKLGLHKQIVNRVLEPFQMMKTVVTATEWDNFFELRTHKDAQPEFQALANLMKEEQDKSTPQQLKEGDWHLPYIETISNASKTIYLVNGKKVTEEEAIKISASCCAQVSYRKNNSSLERALKIYNRLVTSTPIHASPFENQAKAMRRPEIFESKLCSNNITLTTISDEKLGDNREEMNEGITHFDIKGNYWSGNFKNWIQYRQLL